MSMDSPYQNNRSTIYTLTLTNEEVQLKVIYVTFSQVIATPNQNVLLANSHKVVAQSCRFTRQVSVDI